MKIRGIFAISILLLLQNPHFGFAERIKAILEDGVLELESGGQVILAGLQLMPESIPILSILTTQKDIELQYDLPASEESNTENLAGAYLFVNTSEIDFPFSEKTGLRKKRVMVNELLLSMGAARVTEKPLFKRKGEFLLLESAARKNGEGIWSYEAL